MEILHLLNETVMITSFVMVMMLLVEFVNIKTKGNWGKSMQHSRFKQLFFAIGIAVIPGCLGPYAIVSLYTHNIIKFGSLVAASVVSTGDEAFVMLSLFPAKALFLFGILIVIGFLAGWLINRLTPNGFMVNQSVHLHVHHHETEQISLSYKNIYQNLSKISFSRAILVFGLILFMVGILSGGLGHESIHHAEEHSAEQWVNYSFLLVALFTLWSVTAVSQHFLDDHLWEHIIKKHFMRVFLWTLGALVTIAILTHYVDFEQWVGANYWLVLAMALLMGILPVSGPHLLFVTLFAQGTIPFSILLANSIVQDGHGGLPLIAESKRSFIILKATTIFIGAMFGIAGHYFAF